MKQTPFLHLFGALILGMVLGAVGLTAALENGRTEYERLALETPEEAVITFIDTFQARDYAALFLIFTPETQHEWRMRYAVTFDFNYWLQVDKIPEDALDGIYADETNVQNPSVMNYIFDRVMLVAEENDAFVIDLRGDYTLGESEVQDRAAGVVVTVDGQELMFHLRQSIDDRWRVYQILIPGGSADYAPWAPAAEPSGS